jgi:hypothetical protein
MTKKGTITKLELVWFEGDFYCVVVVDKKRYWLDQFAATPCDVYRLEVGDYIVFHLDNNISRITKIIEKESDASSG